MKYYSPDRAQSAKEWLESLIVPLGTVNIAPSKDPFVADDHFKEDEEWHPEIAQIGKEFRKRMFGKIELPLIGSVVSYGNIRYSASGSEIIAALGGPEKAELGLAELSALLQAQIHGEGGPLLTDGWANVFFIKDANESLCEMHAIWGSLKIGDLGMGRNSPGWRLLAHPEERYDGRRVFFRG